MKNTWIDTLLDNELSLLHCKLLLHLYEQEGKAYVGDVVTQTGLRRRFVERCWEERPSMFKKVKLKPRAVIGSSRPQDIGIALTTKGRKIAAEIPRA